MLLQIQDIGLVAYMQMNGCHLAGYEDRDFVVETPDARSCEDWTIEYTNSCCSLHDQRILHLRNLVRGRQLDK